MLIPNLPNAYLDIYVVYRLLLLLCSSYKTWYIHNTRGFCVVWSYQPAEWIPKTSVQCTTSCYLRSIHYSVA